MTDIEIIKVLENSINTYNQKGIYVDTENLQQQVLDLIKRQRAEIERLEKARQRQAYLSCNLRGQKYELMNRISVVKNEAYKEFADRIRQVIVLNNTHDGYLVHDIDYNCLMEDIDDALKELVGENNERNIV